MKQCIKSSIKIKQSKTMSEWVSEWVLLNANSAIFQLYHGENKLIINEMMMRFALFNTLSWIFIVLVHWNNSPRKDMSLHSNTLFWFQATQSLLLRACRRSNWNTNFTVFGSKTMKYHPKCTFILKKTIKFRQYKICGGLNKDNMYEI
jgi:hypothetical protein